MVDTAHMRVSGLSGVPGADMLHQAHQPRIDSHPGEKYSLVIPFPDGAAFNRSNRIFLPPLEMVVDQVMIEFEVTGVGSASALEPTYTWIGDETGNSGIQLLYKAQSLYTATESELVAQQYANVPNCANSVRELILHNDTGNAERKARALELAAPPTAANAGSNYYYLKLGPITRKLMSNLGPINAYAASAWSLDVPLRQALAIAAGAGTSSLVLQGMRLFLTGHREEGVNAMMVSEALANDGIRVMFSQANHKRETVTSGASATAHVTTLSELEGEVTDIWVLMRVAANWNSTTKTTKGNLNWCNGRDNGTSGAELCNIALEQSPSFNRTVDTIAVGTLENPTLMFGQVVPIYTVKNGLMSRSYEGGAYVLAPDGANLELRMRDTQILYMTSQEDGTAGQEYGTYSGSFRVKHNFRIAYSVPAGFGAFWDSQAGPAAAAYTDVILDTIVYIRRVLVVTHSGILMINEN